MKISIFTDIHFGARNNSPQHNQDCTDFVKWFCEQAKKTKSSMVVFMGDWFENRSSINIATLNASYEALRMINDLGVPILFCVGNHDLYHRHTREIYSTNHFDSLQNVKLVNEPTLHDDMMFFPFLFNHEYPEAVKSIQKNKPKYVFGHFEFRGFIITGTNRRMEHGHDHKHFSGPRHVFSGHFHKRQAHDNVIYIGNPFPTNYGDVGDDDRGMAVLDTTTDEVKFLNFIGPTFRKTKLSQILEGDLDFPPGCRVRCSIDAEISYSDAQDLKEDMLIQFRLREFSLGEDPEERKEALEGQQIEFEMTSINDAVIKMITSGVKDTTSIDPSMLVEIYESL